MIVHRALRILGSASLCILAAGALLWGAESLAGGAPALAAGSSPKPAAGIEVKIDNFTFAPAALEVAAGTTVTWVNHDDIPHTVVSTDQNRVFKSKVLDTDEKFSFAFARPGRYAYFCSIHPKMTGEVVVR
jgi:plastocyanin